MKLKYLLLFLFLSFSIYSFGQTDINSIEIKYNDERCFGYKSKFVEDSDTVNYYILFESHFRNEYIEVKKNDSIVYSGDISTGSIMAELVNLGDKAKITEFSIKIGEIPNITLPVFQNMNYVRVGLNRFTGRLVICYSPKRPMLY
jgi:hypothetical protein